MVSHLTEARIGAKGNDWSTEVHEGAIRTNSAKGDLDFMKTKLVSGEYCTGQIPQTFPGWLSLAEARSESRPGKARRYAVKSLDTDLHRLGAQFLISGECQLSKAKANSDATCDTMCL